MFYLSILALLFSPLSNALTVPGMLDTGPNSLAPVSASSNSLGPVATLRLVNQFIAPDGFNRSATLANGVLPAPLIQANTARGDQFSIQVFNELTDASMPLQTSIHWHGLFQKVSNWADGVAYITQCPIDQNQNFEYRFNAVGQSGTYWYHSHFSTQYCDGLRGALVIYDPLDPLRHLYDVDNASTVIVVSEWYHTVSPILGQIVFGPVLPDATLINGLGRYAGGPASPLTVVNVQKGLRYRFRVVATSCDNSFNFTIDQHRMTIIEADGNEVVPTDVDWFIIFPGQRYSVVVSANQPVGNYWIRALNSDSTTFDGGQNLAILRYNGAPVQDPTTSPTPNGIPFSETNLHPLINPRAPGGDIIHIDLDPGFNGTDGLFTFNNVSFINPPISVLLQILSGARHPSQFLPAGSVYVLPPNRTIELSFPNPAAAPGAPHPIHLHGHAFSVVRSAGTTGLNLVNPVRRDVVSIGNLPTDNVTIRFVTDNPGPWFLHCHIDWHLFHGFAVVMAEAPGEAAKQEGKVIPQEWFRLCQTNNRLDQSFHGVPLNYY